MFYQFAKPLKIHRPLIPMPYRSLANQMFFYSWFGSWCVKKCRWDLVNSNIVTKLHCFIFLYELICITHIYISLYIYMYIFIIDIIIFMIYSQIIYCMYSFLLFQFFSPAPVIVAFFPLHFTIRVFWSTPSAQHGIPTSTPGRCSKAYCNHGLTVMVFKWGYVRCILYINLCVNLGAFSMGVGSNDVNHVLWLGTEAEMKRSPELAWEGALV